MTRETHIISEALDTHIEQQSEFVLALDAASASLARVGGKGASLARLAAAGLPVPPGFHVTTAAYQRFVAAHNLQPLILAAIAIAPSGQLSTYKAAAQQITALFDQHDMPDEIACAICAAYAALGEEPPVAVRSSATAEDLPELSFAGQQDSFLNIQGTAALLRAVKKCWASLWTARAIDYRAQHGIPPQEVSLAVVVQQFVPAEAAGVLFTANPLTGSREEMVINAAWGLGEALVGGHVTPDTIVVDKVSRAVVSQQIADKAVMTVRTSEGTREQPVSPDQRQQAVLNQNQAAELARFGAQIEALYDQPMDIEWARSNGEFAILQARPITALHNPSPVAEVWNDSLGGDFLWTNGNLGEAVPDVMTPCAWSLIQIFIADTMPIPGLGGIPLVGNIGGRFYMNLSLLATVAAAFGFSRTRFAEANEQVFGRIPEGLDLPVAPISRWRVLRTMLPVAIRFRRLVAAKQQQLPAFLTEAQARCEALRTQIARTTSLHELRELWWAELLPYFRECSFMLAAGARQDNAVIVSIRRELQKRASEADVEALLSGLNAGPHHLASLGPLLGLEQLARGEIDRATYARQWGHRGPHEFEVSIARPGEAPDWIDRQLAGRHAAPTDMTTLLARQQATQAAAWERLAQRSPRHARRVRRKLNQAAAVFRSREAARSEVVRVFWVLRSFVLRAGDLTGYGDDLFFLTIGEIVALLGGDTAPLAAVPKRRAAYVAYAALPRYPALIRGPFDPFRWAADPHRRSDVFDARGAATPSRSVVSGFPGAAVVVDGRVRVLHSADEGDQLQAGEILVTTVTNIGWTPLFPRAAAIVTDVGAPLSHAAIVARELGIPAVVGCGNATMRLHTGDQVRVDGGQGTVEVLRPAAS